MNSLIQFKGVQIRTAGTKDEPLFCAADICEMLGLGIRKELLRRLPDDEKMSIKGGVVMPPPLAPKRGGAQQMVFVTEPGLYRLVFLSRTKEAEVFKDWVFKRVLPAIRKHGYFVADRDDHPPELLALPSARREAIQLWIAIMQEIAAEKMPHQKIQEIAARYPNTRRFSVPSLYRRFNAWKLANGDWKSQRPYRTPTK